MWSSPKTKTGTVEAPPTGTECNILCNNSGSSSCAAQIHCQRPGSGMYVVGDNMVFSHVGFMNGLVVCAPCLNRWAFDETWGYMHSLTVGETGMVCGWDDVKAGTDDMPTCVKGVCGGHDKDDLLPFSIKVFSYFARLVGCWWHKRVAWDRPHFCVGCWSLSCFVLSCLRNVCTAANCSEDKKLAETHALRISRKKRPTHGRGVSVVMAAVLKELGMGHCTFF